MTLKEAYELLAADENTPIAQIKKSYRRAAKLYHPDSGSGLADTEKFQMAAAAWSMIMENEKAKSIPGARAGAGTNGAAWRAESFEWIRPRPANPSGNGHSKTNGKSRHTPPPNGSSGAYEGAAHSGLLTYNELLIRFDKSPNVWVRIEAAQGIFNQHRDRFEGFAAKRLGGAPQRIQVELIELLGRLRTSGALEALAPCLSSRNPGVVLAAFMALEKAGNAGQAIIDRELKTPSAMTFGLSGLFRRGGLERKVIREGLVPPNRMRRLAAASRKSGVPLQDLLKGMGVPLPQPA